MIEIDNSQLQCYKDCPRKYRNRFILKLRKIKYDERDTDLEFGKCLHSALELLYKGGTLEQAKDIFRTKYIAIESEKAKTPANGERLVEEYWNYAHKQPSDLWDNHMQVIEVEPILDFMITPSIKWIVKPDLIVKNNAGLWTVEHKTTKSLVNFFLRFDPNTQISGQCEGVRQKYGQCSGTIVNALAIGYRERAYKGEPAGFWCSFERDIINRNTDQLNDFKQNVISWVAKLEHSIANDDFPKNEETCHKYRGCAFKSLCLSCDDSQVRETMFELHNPLEYLQKEE